MTKFERIRSVLAGKHPDRLPFSFWHHFCESQREGTAAISAHLKHFAKYDVDFLKIMNDLPYPVSVSRSETTFNANLFTELRGDEGSFGKHLEVIQGLKNCIGHRVPLVTTLFGPWTVLRRYLMSPHLNVRGVPGFGLPPSAVDIQINQLISDRPAEMARVFRVIAKSQSNFARKCIEAGASGVYFSVRKDWPNLGHGCEAKSKTYDDFVFPYDRLCLEGSENGWFNLLHICGEFDNLAEFKLLPSHAVHWADRITGPSLAASASSAGKTVCGGIDNFESLSQLSSAKLIHELQEVLQIGTSIPLVIAPGCAYDSRFVHEHHLQLIRQVVSKKTSTIFADSTDGAKSVAPAALSI